MRLIIRPWFTNQDFTIIIQKHREKYHHKPKDEKMLSMTNSKTCKKLLCSHDFSVDIYVKKICLAQLFNFEKSKSTVKVSILMITSNLINKFEKYKQSYYFTNSFSYFITLAKKKFFFPVFKILFYHTWNYWDRDKTAWILYFNYERMFTVAVGFNDK